MRSSGVRPVSAHDERGEIDVQPALDLIAGARPTRGFAFVGIGGYGAPGKSTLAGRIPHAESVGTDEFWDGDGFELERLRAEVIDALLAGRTAHYHAPSRAQTSSSTARPEGTATSVRLPRKDAARCLDREVS